MRVFIDSSVLLSAAYLKSGASAVVVSFCKKESFIGCVSNYVLKEFKRNASAKFNEQTKNRINQVLMASRLTLVNDPTRSITAKATSLVPSKEAPVLAASLSFGYEYLVTLDIKHFKTRDFSQYIRPLVIVTPRKLLEVIEKK